MRDLLVKMVPSTKLEDKLEGLENFLALKYRIGLILKRMVLRSTSTMRLRNLKKLKLRRSMNKT